MEVCSDADLRVVQCIIVMPFLPALRPFAQCEGGEQPKANRHSPTNQHGNIRERVQSDVCGKGDNDAQDDDRIGAHVIEHVSSISLAATRTVPQRVWLSEGQAQRGCPWIRSPDGHRRIRMTEGSPSAR